MSNNTSIKIRLGESWSEIAAEGFCELYPLTHFPRFAYGEAPPDDEFNGMPLKGHYACTIQENQKLYLKGKNQSFIVTAQAYTATMTDFS